MPELNSNLNVFRQHFDVFDTAAHGGNRDRLVSRSDIEAVANGDQYTAEQRAAARYLLDHPEAYALLDTGRDGGGLYRADGRISREDVDSVFGNTHLFDETGTFVSDRPLLPEDASPGFDSPIEAAAQTQNVRMHSISGGEDAAAGQFMSLISEHKDDPRWLQQYFNALGAQDTARLLSKITSPSRYANGDADFANQSIADARAALQNMYASGALQDADIARMVEHWAMERGDFNTGVAQLFAGLEGPQAEGMKNAFYRATMELALSGHDLKDRTFTFSDNSKGRLSTGDRESLAAAGSFVLGQTSYENRTNQLIKLQASGGDNAIDSFIRLAMANPTEVFGPTALTGDAESARLRGENYPDRNVSYDGVAKLVEALSFDTTYRSGADHLLPSVPYSYTQLQSVRDQVFYSASNGLDANRNEWQQNTELKDGLARIFMADYDVMLQDALSASGSTLNPQHPFVKALEGFSQNVLFTEPSGVLRDGASEFLIDRLSTLIYDANNMDDVSFKTKYGADQTQMVHVAGNILGRINNGMEQAVQVSSDRRATEQKNLEFGLNLALALGQDGIKFLPGGNVAALVLPDRITGSSTYGHIKGEIEGLLMQGLTDQASERLLEEFPDLKADEALSGLFQRLTGVVEGNNDHDLLSAFLSSYNYANDNPIPG